MRMKKNIGWILGLLCFLFVGCSKPDVPTDIADKGEQKLTFVFRLSQDAGSVSRADNVVTPTQGNYDESTTVPDATLYDVNESYIGKIRLIISELRGPIVINQVYSPDGENRFEQISETDYQIEYATTTNPFTEDREYFIFVIVNENPTMILQTIPNYFELINTQHDIKIHTPEQLARSIREQGVGLPMFHLDPNKKLKYTGGNQFTYGGQPLTASTVVLPMERMYNKVVVDVTNVKPQPDADGNYSLYGYAADNVPYYLRLYGMNMKQQFNMPNTQDYANVEVEVEVDRKITPFAGKASTLVDSYPEETRVTDDRKEAGDARIFYILNGSSFYEVGQFIPQYRLVLYCGTSLYAQDAQSSADANRKEGGTGNQLPVLELGGGIIPLKSSPSTVYTNNNEKDAAGNIIPQDFLLSKLTDNPILDATSMRYFSTLMPKSAPNEGGNYKFKHNVIYHYKILFGGEPITDQPFILNFYSWPVEKSRYNLYTPNITTNPNGYEKTVEGPTS